MASAGIKFCPNCKNMLFLRDNGRKETLTATHSGAGTEETGVNLIEFCRRCGYESRERQQKGLTGEEAVVYRKVYKGVVIKPRIPDVVFEDPAVPTTELVPCKNDECPSNKAEKTHPRSIAYIVLDNDKFEFLYRCRVCSHTWKNTITSHS
jgi:DNA-directed RNA polymerase subunit M/transcription elongation factor TFIIS